MRTHLIMDLDDFGIWADDYETFLRKRAGAVSDELKKRLIERRVDTQGQELRDDDVEEELATFQ
jgi:hypothetical protein